MICSYMTFTVASERYGVALEDVREIITYKGFTKIPDSKPWIVGLIQTREQTMPIIDLRIRFETEMKPLYNAETVIIATKIAQGKLLGLVVDMVEDIMTFEREAILSSEGIETEFNSNLIRGHIQTPTGSILILNHAAFAPLNSLPSIASIFEDKGK